MGFIVGPLDGLAVGLLDGLPVGALDGDPVGEVVGGSEGATKELNKRTDIRLDSVHQIGTSNSTENKSYICANKYIVLTSARTTSQHYPSLSPVLASTRLPTRLVAP